MQKYKNANNIRQCNTKITKQEHNTKYIINTQIQKYKTIYIYI